MEIPPCVLSARWKDAGTTPGIKIITLLTDFGLKDPYVGIMKGVILSINPEATIVDITHDITPQNVEEAAFLIEEYHRYFPPGTIHLAVIDPTVGSKRRPIIVSKDNNVFIGPDNGLFTLILNDAEVYLLENPDFMLKEVSSTFHGRDIFAPAAAHASTGFHPSAFGRMISDPLRLNNMFPTIEGNSLNGRIVRFDSFGNAITNIKIDFLKHFLGNQQGGELARGEIDHRQLEGVVLVGVPLLSHVVLQGTEEPIPHEVDVALRRLCRDLELAGERRCVRILVRSCPVIKPDEALVDVSDSHRPPPKDKPCCRQSAMRVSRSVRPVSAPKEASPALRRLRLVLSTPGRLIPGALDINRCKIAAMLVRRASGP